MKILIGIAVFDSVENKRTEYTKKTYESLIKTTDPKTTDIVFVNNASCKETVDFLNGINMPNIKVIHSKENVGTAEAINIAWKEADKETFCVKLDNDVTFKQIGWAERMAECFTKDSYLGIVGLKRKDLPNEPISEQYQTTLVYLRHKKGEPWLFENMVEYCDDLIGTCHMFNPKLLEQIGYLWQPGIYGFDDVLACTRSRLAGFRNAFYPSIEIEHLDDGNNPYIEWKKRYAGMYLPTIEKIEREYETGERPLYYSPFD